MKATIKHPSISTARVIDLPDNITAAKKAATKEFGDEQADYYICILDSKGDILTKRKVKKGSKWTE